RRRRRPRRVRVAAGRQPSCGVDARRRADARDVPAAEQILRERRPRARPPGPRLGRHLEPRARRGIGAGPSEGEGAMRIARIEDLHCDAGWRVFSFLKITTDDGIIGWSEYNESYGSRGLTAVIHALGERIIGHDPRPSERITATLYAITRQAPGGLNQQAIAAIENALTDIRAKALGVPVHALFGGPIRERLPLYWSHCGSYRLNHAEVMGVKPLRTLADLERLGAEVKERGFHALKTNIFLFDETPPAMYQPGFVRARTGYPELNAERRIREAIAAELRALRDGAGPDMALHLDLNFNFKTEGYRQVAQVVEPFELSWLEIDSYDAAALA